MRYWKQKGAISLEWFEMRRCGSYSRAWFYYTFFYGKVNSESDFNENLVRHKLIK
jgi:hypothetical protein